MVEYKSPQKTEKIEGNLTVFLGGSIEMGVADDWQTKLVKELKNESITFYNPRRENWDSSLVQSIDDLKFKEQVVWELDNLESADTIVIAFDPATKSPISLLELGLFAKSGRLIVLCPEGFYRKGNVDIICERYLIVQVSTFADLADKLKEISRLHGK
jgi:hypothetical protein